jgi:predicted transcriptional regulator
MATPRKRQIPEPKGNFEVIAVRVEADLRRKLEELAKDDERTLSQLARMALREFVERKIAPVAA